MSEALLKAAGAGRWEISGTLDFSTVPVVWPQLQQEIRAHKQLEISLQGVVSSNSAALALLLEAKDFAAAGGASLRFSDLPRGMTDLAALSNALPLLS